MKIALIGFGNVGQGLAEILRDKADELDRTADFRAEIVAVATRSGGSLYHPDGLDIDQLLDAVRRGHLDDYPDVYGLNRNWETLKLIRHCNADVLVEVTDTNLQTGQPALDYCLAGLDSGKHVVLANKGPVAVGYAQLLERASLRRRELRFEATVMAGTPCIRLALGALKGCQISQARGILNGTTNFILTQMEGGMPYAAALAEAQRLGYAEADPTADVDGWDTAAKVMILARALFDHPLALADMDVTGIRNISSADMAEAQAAGERWKLIAHVTPEGGSVAPERLPITHPLAGPSYTTNAITYTTDLLGDVTLIGSGAGRYQTGFGLLSDLLEIHKT